MEPHDALTAGAHVALIFSAVLVLLEVTWLVKRPELLERALTSSWLRVTAYAALTALILERSFYVAARILIHRGIDLWGAHPAPAVLSAITAAAIFACWAALIRETASSPRAAGGSIVAHAAVIAAACGACVLVMVGAA
jgi:hypothetical protein